MNLPAEVAASLGPSGPLRQLPNYEPRIEQARLAQRIGHTFQQRGRLVAEAGTGVGKSMAYLIPAVLSQKSVLISTYTKALQDQLFTKDLPFLDQHFRKFTAAKLKGRNNYLCLYRLRGLQKLIDRHEAPPLDGALDRWIEETDSGDMDEYPGMLSFDMRRKLTISSEDCLRRRCPVFKDCWAEESHRVASLANIVVVNHALLMIDLHTGTVLPARDHIVIDEAHHLPQAASGVQEVSLSLFRINQVLRANVARVDLYPQDLAGRVSSMVYTWLESFADRMGSGNKEAYTTPLPYYQDCLESLGEMVTWWKAHGGAVRDRVAEMTASDPSAREIAIEQVGKESDKLLQLFVDFSDVANPKHTKTHAYWTQRDRTRDNFNYSLHRAPTNMGPWLAKQLWRVDDPKAPSVVAVSATISQGKDFSHFMRETGCKKATTHVEGSPFDFKTQALFYVPQVPAPNGSQDSEDREDVMAWEIQRTIKAASGGVFVLFTSWARCRNMYDRLFPEIVGHRPVYMQGHYPTLDLIARFKRDGNAVLFATRSFWEGVDVQGDALQVVMIDRLPFPTPADPIYKAKSAYLESIGLRPFFVLAVPETSLALKQGMGRLIRSQDDRGVVVFLDPRIVTKGYGKTIRDALPNAPLTRSFEEVEEFLDDVTILF